MSSKTFHLLELLLGGLAIVAILTQAVSPNHLPWVAVGILALLILDLGRARFPFYGFLSPSCAGLLALCAMSASNTGLCTLGLLLLAGIRWKLSSDLLPCALLLAARSWLGWESTVLAGAYLILTVAHPLFWSKVATRLPVRTALKTWPFHLGCACVLALSSRDFTVQLVLCQFFLLVALGWLAKGQTGLNAEAAYEQEQRELRSEETEESLRLIDALAYSLHEQAEPAQVLSRVSDVMRSLAGADTHCLIERDGPRWRIVEEEGIGKENATKAFSRLQSSLGAECRPRRLKKTWSSEQSALVVCWENEAVLYLGFKNGKPGHLKTLERLARIGAAALRTAHEKVQRKALGERGEHLEQWVGSLTKLLKDVHFVASTLERTDVLHRLEATLSRTLRPDLVLVFSSAGIEQVWGDQALLSDLDLLVDIPRGKSLGSSPIEGHANSVCVGLGESSMLLSFREKETLQDSHIRYLLVLSDIVATFLSNSELYGKLHRAHSELEQSQTDLVQAKKLAAVGQLAAGVAHELNSPFQAIAVHLDLVKMSVQDPEDLECLETIEQALARCSTIVRELLHFSRKPNEQKVPLSVKKILEQAVITAGLKLNPESEELVVDGSEHELVGLFTNLLTNARDAVKARFPDQDPNSRITIQATRAKQSALVQVKDLGGGIPTEVQERILEPFFTTKEVGSGTGLGLYMVHTYVAQAGGELSFQCEEGESTTFQVRLPLKI